MSRLFRASRVGACPCEQCTARRDERLFAYLDDMGRQLLLGFAISGAVIALCELARLWGAS